MILSRFTKLKPSEISLKLSFMKFDPREKSENIFEMIVFV